MSGLIFDEFVEGKVYITPTRTITETDVVNFAALTGDYNELHTSETFSKNTPFGSRIAHGQLVTSVSEGLVFRLGILDGTALALLGIDKWEYLGPVFFGDTIHCEIKVKEKVPSKSKHDRGIVKIQYSIINQNNQLVQQGIKTVMVKR